MNASLGELYSQLNAALTSSVEAVEGGDLELAREGARIILSAGSKLHARLGILVDMRGDANWRAEVDRALRRAAAAKPPEIPGQASLAEVDVVHPQRPDQPPSRLGKPESEPKGKRPRRGKGGDA